MCPCVCDELSVPVRVRVSLLNTCPPPPFLLLLLSILTGDGCVSVPSSPFLLLLCLRVHTSYTVLYAGGL